MLPSICWLSFYSPPGTANRVWLLICMRISAHVYSDGRGQHVSSNQNKTLYGWHIWRFTVFKEYLMPAIKHGSVLSMFSAAHVLLNKLLASIVQTSPSLPQWCKWTRHANVSRLRAQCASTNVGQNADLRRVLWVLVLVQTCASSSNVHYRTSTILCMTTALYKTIDRA